MKISAATVSRAYDLFSMTKDEIRGRLFLLFVSEDTADSYKQKSVSVRNYYGYPAVIGLFVRQDDDEVVSIVPNYTDAIAEKLGMDMDELFEAARVNMMSLFPARKLEALADDVDSVDYVAVAEKIIGITTDNGLFATAILYDGLVEKLSSFYSGSNLWLLPSSVHEWLVVPCDLFPGKTAEVWTRLVDMTTEVNSIMDSVDILGRYPLYYDAKKGVILTSEEIGMV